MKKISVIFSILTIALLAIVAMGCPVAYYVGSPYSATLNVSLNDEGGNTTTVTSVSPAYNYDGIVSTYTSMTSYDPTSVTFSGTALSGSDWNMSFITTITGGNIPAGTIANFVSTKKGNYNGWWGYDLTGYLQVGGTITGLGGTLDNPSAWTITGGTGINCSYGGGLSWAYTYKIDVTGANGATAPLVITMNNNEHQNGDPDGTVNITGIRIDF